MVVSHNWHGNENRSPIIARSGSCSCRILFQAYFIATRDGKETQNKMFTLVLSSIVWFEATIRVLFRVVGVGDALYVHAYSVSSLLTAIAEKQFGPVRRPE